MTINKTQAMRLVEVSKQLFDIDISLEKLVNDESYRQLVCNELGNLNHPDLNVILNALVQTQPSQDFATATDKKNKTPVFVAAASIVVALLAGTWFALNTQMPDSEQPVAQSVKTPQSIEQPVAVQTVKSAEPAIVANKLFNIHGSNTIGEKLAPALIEAFYREQGGSDFEWQTQGNEVERVLTFKLDGKPQQIALAAHGSSTAFKDLQAGVAQIGMASRKIKETEVESLKDQNGDLSKVGNEHIIALDGLAVIVNQNNPLKFLSIEQLAQIFSGEIANWQQLGGDNAPIRVLARDANSGTWDTFKSLVLKKHDKRLLPSAERFESSSHLSDEVSRDDYAIGFIGLNYIQYNKALAISEGDGSKAIYPTRFTIATEDYALARRLYIYTPTSSDRTVKDFAYFAISDKGQEIVQQNGLIAQTIRLEKVDVETGAPYKYRQYVQTAERLSLNFRFNYGNRDLDNKGKRDLERLVKFVEKNPNKQLVLMGFSDNQGDAEKNLALSLNRAKAVEQELNARGIDVKSVEGFGELLPVASNLSTSGRERNRRVEVWLL